MPRPSPAAHEPPDAAGSSPLALGAKLAVSAFTLYHLWFLVSTNLTPSPLQQEIVAATGTRRYGVATGMEQTWDMFVTIPPAYRERYELYALIGERREPMPETWPDEHEPDELHLQERSLFMRMMMPNTSPFTLAYLHRAGLEAARRFETVDRIEWTAEIDRLSDRPLADVRATGRIGAPVRITLELELWALTDDGSEQPLPAVFPGSHEALASRETSDEDGAARSSRAEATLSDLFADYLTRACRLARDHTPQAQTVELRLHRVMQHQRDDGRWVLVLDRSDVLGSLPCR